MAGTQWLGDNSSKGGSSALQMPSAYGQRVRKWQPEGGLMGLGTSPFSTICLRSIVGSGMGTAESRLRCKGAAVGGTDPGSAPVSTILPGTSPPPGWRCA